MARKCVMKNSHLFSFVTRQPDKSNVSILFENNSRVRSTSPPIFCIHFLKLNHCQRSCCFCFGFHSYDFRHHSFCYNPWYEGQTCSVQLDRHVLDSLHEKQTQFQIEYSEAIGPSSNTHTHTQHFNVC